MSMRRDERGASAVLVGILLMVLVIGSGAIAIDIGTLWANRKALQNGVDAAALSLATKCAQGSSSCLTNTSTPKTAQQEAAFFVAGAYPTPLNPQATCADDGRTGGVCVTFGANLLTVYAWDYVIPAFPFMAMFGGGAGAGKLKVGATASAKYELPSLPLIFASKWIENIVVGETRTICPDSIKNFPYVSTSYQIGPSGTKCWNPDPTADGSTYPSSGNFFSLDTADTAIRCVGQQPGTATYEVSDGTTIQGYKLQVATGMPVGCNFSDLVKPGNVIFVPIYDSTQPVANCQDALPRCTVCPRALLSCTGAKGEIRVTAYGQFQVLGYCLKYQGSLIEQYAGVEADGLTPVTAVKGGNCEGSVGGTNYTYPYRMSLMFKGYVSPSEVAVLKGIPIRLVS